MSKCKTILNNENEKLLVEVFAPKKEKSTIVFCHGITGCRKGRTMSDSYLQELAKLLMGRGYKVVLFDFSGHGESEGKDFDVTLTKSTSELEVVLANERVDLKNVNFLAFSYGAAVLANYLSKHTEVDPKSMVFYSPCLFPLESCFLNADSIFGKDIVKEYQSGNLAKNGFAVVGAKGFKFGSKMIDSCKDFTPEYLKKFASKILVLSGKQDVILNTKYNDRFCKKLKIDNIYLNASHSLFEEIDSAFNFSIDFFEKHN